VDLGDWDKLAEALRDIEALDGLVNNAAYDALGKFADVGKEDIDKYEVLVLAMGLAL